ncbi:hypothetical protein JX265_010832 [Neoarthrinium moseri]|uniref:Uncharacterized protein n=1 Tax=Neoarthrinium moseri TaxID=1658444 RepID=A0A9P9WDI1_9PEZI|nr:hypothetical protein JX266_011936 [Neoarthrinium moseri]KAI1858164.1 hypothetical protein JX265_010832 [Neoarthrinium moseri]
MATKTDYQVASLAAGFTIGFGFLTVWEAAKQTRRNKNPLRSSYIYMVWGEIVANLCIAVIGWVFLDGILGPTVPVLFFILFLWVFEVQLLMQIIINRIAIIHESPKHVAWMKWGTVVIITTINILVFCIWIPAHTNPPASELFVHINEYWDRISKVLILIVDAGLNWYFLRVVKKRLLDHYGLVKYKPLVSFNAKLMVVSILMDVMLIGLMSLPNQVVYIQFHPVAYMVKLNIEMSMASLITRLARTGANDVHMNTLSESDRRRAYGTDEHTHTSRDVGLKSFTQSRVRGGLEAQDNDFAGIQRTVDFNVTVQQASPSESTRKGHVTFDKMDDEVSLTHHAGHPTASIKEVDGRSSSASEKSR